MEQFMEKFKCDNCYKESHTLYELWCYNSQRNNPFAIGTTTASLLQKRVLCLECIRIMYDAKLTKLEERP